MNSIVVAIVFIISITINSAKTCLPSTVPEFVVLSVGREINHANKLAKDLVNADWKDVHCCFSYSSTAHTRASHLCFLKAMATGRLEGALCQYFSSIGKLVTHMANHKSLSNRDPTSRSDHCKIANGKNDIFHPLILIRTDGKEKLENRIVPGVELENIIKDESAFRAAVMEREYNDILNKSDLLTFLLHGTYLNIFHIVDTLNCYFEPAQNVVADNAFDWKTFESNTSRQLDEIRRELPITGKGLSLNSAMSKVPFQRHNRGRIVITLGDMGACLVLGLKDLIRSLAWLFMALAPPYQPTP